MLNDLDKINNLIENIRNNICDYNLKDMFINIDSLILHISNCVDLKKMNKDKINVFNTILENVNSAIQNKDYQLVADILKFQLKEFIDSISIEGGRTDEFV